MKAIFRNALVLLISISTVSISFSEEVGKPSTSCQQAPHWWPVETNGKLKAGGAFENGDGSLVVLVPPGEAGPFSSITNLTNKKNEKMINRLNNFLWLKIFMNNNLLATIDVGNISSIIKYNQLKKICKSDHDAKGDGYFMYSLDVDEIRRLIGQHKVLGK